MAVRFFLLNSLFALLFVLLGFNLYGLQIKEGGHYFERAQARAEAREELSLRRGRIFIRDRNGADIFVALNRNEPAVYANPKQIEDNKEAAAFLAPLLNVSAASLEKTFANKENQFKLLAEKASPELIEALREAPKGIYVDEKQYRFYPFERFAAHLLGFVGINASTDRPRGLYGVEKYFEAALAEEEDVYLSLDRTVQAEAEATLARLIAEYGATGGTIIVEDPKTGKLIALTSKPDFDPNNYGASPIANFVNPAFSHVYEPGSVMKAMTMASALDAGAVTPTTTFIDRGFVTRDHRTIRNFDNKVYGEVTMTNVIERSINMGSVFAAEQLGRAPFVKYLEAFGFGAVSGLGTPDEVAGSLKNLTKRDTKAIDLATASFGQGTAVTPLQLVNAYATLANKGVRMTPSFMWDEAPRVAARAVSERAASEVLAMMESAVNVNTIATIPGYRVAGKTGTALIPDFVNGGYSDELIHNYVGTAPVSDPRFVILVKLDKPQVGELAGLTVVPAFRDLVQFLLTYYRIPPDNLSHP
ncbi:MAG: penicillin-binding protein 2 [Candidatus Jorgensenbacteria bacterium]|nr:penicillin-binding protein 2 [Candidatus Jorgensenbacteria bacterium]